MPCVALHAGVFVRARVVSFRLASVLLPDICYPAVLLASGPQKKKMKKNDGLLADT
jgi:hypothetical protein